MGRKKSRGGRQKSGGGRKRKLNVTDKSNGTQAGSTTAIGIIAQDITVRQETNQLENQGGPPTLPQYDPPQTERPGSSGSSQTRASQRGSAADNLEAFAETPPSTLVGTISTRHIVKEDQVNRATNTGNGRVVIHVAESMTVGGNQRNELGSSGHLKDPIESTDAASLQTGNRKRKASNNTSIVALKSKGAVKADKININVHNNNNTFNNLPSISGTSQVIKKPSPPFGFEVPNPSKHFKGRGDTFQAVWEFFDNVAVDSSDVLDRSIVIAGLGGMGKTETAYKVAADAEVHGIFYVVFMNAETPQSLIESFRRLASTIGVNLLDQQLPDVDLVKKVYHHIDQQDYSKMLFIFDNAIRFNSKGDEFGLYDYLPTWRLDNKRYPYILITTQTHEWGNQIKVLRVELLSFDESMAFFSSAFSASSIEDECYEEFERLHKITEGYPLVMNLVASNIDYSRNDNSVRELLERINDYIQEFEEEKAKILTEEMKHWPTTYKKTLEVAWQMTFKRLQEVEGGPEALQVLQYMSFFNLPIYSPNIQKILLYNTTDCWKCVRFKENSLQLKKSYYLLERFYAARILEVEKNDEYEFRCILGIHRLVQLAVREQTNCSQTLEHILWYQVKSYGVVPWWQLNREAVHVALLQTPELTPRALTFVGILACYSNAYARTIVGTRKPKETAAAATIWRLYNLRRRRISLSGNEIIQELRELVELAKFPELKEDKLTFIALTLDLLDDKKRFGGRKYPGCFVVQSCQGTKKLAKELIMLMYDLGCSCRYCAEVDDVESLMEKACKIYCKAVKFLRSGSCEGVSDMDEYLSSDSTENNGR